MNELKHIAGNEKAKRALEIALKGKHSIKFIGNWEAKEFEKYAKKLGLRAFSFKPCECGNLESEKKACTCEHEQIAKQQAKIRNCKTGLTIKTATPPALKMVKVLKAEFKDKVTNDSLWDLLAQAISKLHLEFNEAKACMQVAETIAELARESKINNAHLAEALQYRPK